MTRRLARSLRYRVGLSGIGPSNAPFVNGGIELSPLVTLKSPIPARTVTERLFALAARAISVPFGG